MRISGSQAGVALLLVGITAISTWLAALNYLRASHGNGRSAMRTGSAPLVESRLGPEQPMPSTKKAVRIEPQESSRNQGDTKSPGFSDDQSEQERFKELVSQTVSNGDFTLLGDFLDGVKQVDRYEYFKQVPGIFTRLGPTRDIREKVLLLDKLNVSASSLAALRDKILQAEAVERYDQMKSEGVIAGLTDKEFARVCHTLAASRVKQGFSKVEDAPNESARRAAAAEVARCAIAGGIMEASKEIGRLPPGIVKDEAVVELVRWLRRTGSSDEAEPWSKLVVDEKARERLDP